MNDFNVENVIATILQLKDAPVDKPFKVNESDTLKLCHAAREILLRQASLLEIESPTHICGDIHGQYSDLLRIFDKGGYPPDSNYLFMGDYVDRGKHSLETICLLLAYKVRYPENFYLLRGNHESANITRVYGFYDECKRRCSIKVWKTFCDVFDCLPVACIVGGIIFCCHGGLSPSLRTMDDIRKIQRPIPVPEDGLVCDLLWADPDADVGEWGENERGASVTFGAKTVEKFLKKHDLDLICRGHQVVEDGYQLFAKRKLVTIFSAPNYCGVFDNAGAIMKIDPDYVCSFLMLEPLKLGAANALQQ